MKKALLLSALAALGATSSAFAQFVDNCVDATTPLGTGTYTFDLSAATNDAVGFCGATDTAPDQWIQFMPSISGIATFSACGLTGMDTVLSVFDACGGTEVTCNDDTCGLESQVSLTVTASVPVYVRIAGFGGDVGSGSIACTLTPVSSGGPVDDCAAAEAVGDGTYVFDTATATNDGTVVGTCAGSDAAPDLWIRYHPTGSGNATISLCGSSYDTAVNVWDACPGSGGTMIACNDDFCGLSSQTTFSVTAGTDVYIRLAGFAGQSGPGVATVTGPTPPPPGSWFESGEAGSTPADAQTPSGSGPLNAIFGNIASSGDADLYRIEICDPSSFSATTVNNETAGDTQLFIFDANGIGVVMDDDDPTGAGGLLSRLSSAFITSPGTYFLAIARYDNDPVDEGGSDLWMDTPYDIERAPDGPGAANPIGGWSGTSLTGAYRVDLTGACYPGGAPPCDPDYNCDGNADQDDVAWLVNAIASADYFSENCGGEKDPDFNAEGNVDQDDIAALINTIASSLCP